MFDDGSLAGTAERSTAFSCFHPACALGYFAVVAVLVMASFQPVLIGISLCSGLAFSLYLRGGSATVKSLAWQISFVALVALINPLFASQGSTVLFRIGAQPVYLESTAYGLCMGLLLIATLVWFSNAAQVISFDQMAACVGNRFPTIALMLAMIARLAPRNVRRGHQIAAVQKCCLPPAARTKRASLQDGARLASVLMGWSLEDSLEQGDAMRARGWNAGVPRSTYQRYTMRRRDGALLVGLAALTLLCGITAYAACTQYRFYPSMSTLTMWWGYIPFAVLSFGGLAACLIGDARWSQASRRAGEKDKEVEYLWMR